jgi:acetylornithine aminotransferase
MKMFDVYPVYPVQIERGSGCFVYDQNGKEYLDFYGGHAVISIGHAHPVFVNSICEQVNKLAFYSNSIEIPVQKEYAKLLGDLSGYPEYDLFLCSSGAEANENALKLASFHTNKSGVIAFHKGFHGRTSAAVAATDNSKVQAPLNKGHKITLCPLNDLKAVKSILEDNQDICCIIIEGIQGVGGIYEPTTEFLKGLRQLCDQYEIALILDEVQSGFGRTGKFFAHQHAGIKPDLITTAKGMGNGYPIGGVLIAPKFQASYGLLGTTFGGNHLACAAGMAVLKVIASENLIEDAAKQGDYLKEQLKKIDAIKEVRGNGLMLAAEVDFPVAALRKKLVVEKRIFTGGSSNPNTIRFLPPLNIGKEEIDFLIDQLKASLQEII